MVDAAAAAVAAAATAVAFAFALPRLVFVQKRQLPHHVLRLCSPGKTINQ